jgi:bacterioferritin
LKISLLNKYQEEKMQADPRVIEVLNPLLSDELTAVNQYMVHSEMCDNWGYEKLHKVIEKRAIDEMKHAEKLIARIIFLEGIPIVSKLNEINIGSDVPKMFTNDHGLEAMAIKNYNSAILVCGEAKDFATREILEHILNEEDAHIDGIEEVQDELAQMGTQIFLSTQMS